jgi:hypothetical protein
VAQAILFHQQQSSFINSNHGQLRKKLFLERPILGNDIAQMRNTDESAVVSVPARRQSAHSEAMSMSFRPCSFCHLKCLAITVETSCFALVSANSQLCCCKTLSGYEYTRGSLISNNPRKVMNFSISPVRLVIHLVYSGRCTETRRVSF